MNIEEFSKKKVIDCIWNSRIPSEVKMSVREPITERIFSPISSHWGNLNRIIMDSETETVALMNIFDLYRENKSFRLSIDKSIKDATIGYYEVLNRHTGLTSVIAWALIMRNYPSKFDDIRNELIQWYIKKRKQDEMIIAGGIIWNSVNIAEILSQVFVNIATHLIIKISERPKKQINNSVKNCVFDILERDRIRIVEENKKIPKEFLLNYLYAFELAEKEIDEFEKLIISSLYDLLKNIDCNEQILFLEYLKRGEIMFNEKKDVFEHLLIPVEINNQKIEYVIDPFAIIIIK